MRSTITAYAGALAAAAVVGLSTGCSTGTDRAAADSVAGKQDVAALRARERPVVRHLKLAFVALSKNENARGSAEVEHALSSGRSLTTWLHDHKDVEEANSASLECVDSTLRELADRFEEARPGLASRGHATSLRRLRIQITETVNCIQFGD